MLKELAKHLKEDFGLRPCDDLETLAKASVETAYVERPEGAAGPWVRIAHYDFDPAMLIYDPRLGTVGIVEYLDAPEAEFVQKIRAAIDRAAHVRQLLLLDAEAKSQAENRTFALQVELVLVVGPAAAQEPIGEILRRVARETGYLRAIGINLLRAGEDGKFGEADLRRSFCWLLRHTRNWYKQPPQPLAAPWSLTLTNYRVGGTRRFEFTGDSRVHLLHGFNGSGKSSVCEALELHVTGTIERLDEAGKKDYFAAVRHRPYVDPTPVEVVIELANAASPDRRLINPGSGPVSSDTFVPSASSFRLNQSVMDRIVRSDPAGRGRLFLRSFFPGDWEILQLEEARLTREAESTLRALPKRIRDQAPQDRKQRIEWVIDTFGWTGDQKQEWKQGVLKTLEPVLPMRADQLEALKPISRHLTSLLDQWTKLIPWESAEDVLRQLDEVLRRLSSPAATHVETLRPAAALFREFNEWEALGQSNRGESLEHDLNDWLELTALADLTGKYYDVVATLELARQRGWTARPGRGDLLPAPVGDSALRTLEGHSSPVSGVAATSNGKWVVSASEDHTLRVWELETGRALRTLEGHSRSVSSVAVMPDGKRAVSASADRTLKVWDLETGRMLHTLEGHSSSVYGVAVTPDGKLAVSASGDHTLRVWDMESSSAVRTLEGHTTRVYAVAITPDGKRAVSASGDHMLRVWDLEHGRALRTLEGHSDFVRGVAVTPDAKRAVSASGDHTLRVWDLETGRALHTLEGHSDEVWGVAVTPDGKWVVSASLDHALRVWDLETGRGLGKLEGHSDSVRGVIVTPDGRRAVSASRDHTLKVWDLESISATTDRLRKQRDDLVRERDAARAKLEAWRTQPTTKVAKAAGGKSARRLLNDPEIAALNRAASLLPSVGVADLGDRVAQALRTDSPQTVGKVVLGTKGGLQKTLDEELQPLLEACEVLASEGSFDLPESFRAARSCLYAHQKLKDLDTRIGGTFIEKIATGSGGEAALLNAALNELLALFTPARWAYRDLDLRSQRTESGHTLSLETLGAEADLLWNTAELNSLTLSLFLLCAPRVKNALRLLVLDDPLQNMDELTVNAVARGFGKVVRILPEDWQVLALFHGEGNVHTIREEVPCAIYEIPWLRPAPGAVEPTITERKNLSTWKAQIKSLNGLLGPP